MKLMEIKNGYNLFLDMDGVFADFGKGIEKLMLNVPYSEYRYDTDPEYKKRMWELVGEYQKDGDEFWYDLDLLPDAMTLWNYVKKYNPTFLSATGRTNHEHTKDQKRRWIDEKFGDIPGIFVHSAEDKKKEADENHILIDDKMKAIEPWVNAGGIGILHTSAQETIARLKDLGL